MKKRGFRCVAWLALALAASPVFAQLEPRLALESQGRQGAEALREIARQARALYAPRGDFSGVNESSLARSGAAPARWIKWGQIMNPAGEGFLTVRPFTLPGRPPLSSAEMIIPFVSPQACRPFLAELALSPEIAGVYPGEALMALPLSGPLTESELEGVCDQMAKRGARLIVPLPFSKAGGAPGGLPASHSKPWQPE